MFMHQIIDFVKATPIERDNVHYTQKHQIDNIENTLS